MSTDQLFAGVSVGLDGGQTVLVALWLVARDKSAWVTLCANRYVPVALTLTCPCQSSMCWGNGIGTCELYVTVATQHVGGICYWIYLHCGNDSFVLEPSKPADLYNA